MKTVTLAQKSMGTRFEIALIGEREPFLQAVGEEALREIARLERQLSLYRDDSDLAEINAYAALNPVRVEPRLFRFLERAIQLSNATLGAFDFTVAPLMQAWGFIGGAGNVPEPEALEWAKSVGGVSHLLLDEANYTIAFDIEGVRLDFGAIGKGYAIDAAIEILRDYEIETALLHGGASSVYALGAPPGADGWQIAIHNPQDESKPFAIVTLKDAALSVSAPHNKKFVANGQTYGHVLNPRAGSPSSGNILAALVTENATDGDALSTALLADGAAALANLEIHFPEAQILLVTEENGVTARGTVWRDLSSP